MEHKLLVCAKNLLGSNVSTTKKNTEVLMDASKETGTKVNTVDALLLEYS
jgi:hypothetical protein